MGLCLDVLKMLKPLPGRVLVEIREQYNHVAVTQQKYDTRTSGVVVEMAYLWKKDDPLTQDEIQIFYPKPGQLVFWEEYKDGAVIERNGKKYAFIKIDDLDGYEDVEAN